MTAQQTGERFVHLLTLDHASLAQPYRLVDTREDLVSGGETFVAFPFDVVLPSDTEEESPRAQIQISNVTRELVAAVRALPGPMQVRMDVARYDDPDDIVASWPDFELSQVTIDSLTLSGDLGLPDAETEPAVAYTFNPSMWPGLY